MTYKMYIMNFHAAHFGRAVWIVLNDLRKRTDCFQP